MKEDEEIGYHIHFLEIDRPFIKDIKCTFFSPHVFLKNNAILAAIRETRFLD